MKCKNCIDKPALANSKLINIPFAGKNRAKWEAEAAEELRMKNNKERIKRGCTCADGD